MNATVHDLAAARLRSAQRRAAGRARHPACAGRGPDPDDWVARAHGVLDAVEQLLAHGRAADVLAFCRRAVALLEENAAEVDDPAPLVRLARRLGDLERRAAAAGGPRPRGRQRGSRPSRQSIRSWGVAPSGTGTSGPIAPY